MLSGNRFSLFGEYGRAINADSLGLVQTDSGLIFEHSARQHEVCLLKPNWAPRYCFMTAHSKEFGLWPLNHREADCITALSDLAHSIGIDSAKTANLKLDTLLDSSLKVSSETRMWLQHLIAEQARLGWAAEAISDGKPLIFGNLLDQSEFSLKRIFNQERSLLCKFAAWLASIRGVLGVRRSRCDNNQAAVTALLQHDRSAQVAELATKEFAGLIQVQQLTDFD